VRFCRAEFPGLEQKGHIKWTLNEDSGTTGNFEVKLNGELIHSKKSGGKGRCQEAAERDAVLGKIKQALLAAKVDLPEPDKAAKDTAEMRPCLII